MAEDTTIEILTRFEQLERRQKRELADLLYTIYGGGPHHEVLLRRLYALITTAKLSATALDVNWQSVCTAVSDYIENELHLEQPVLGGK